MNVIKNLLVAGGGVLRGLVILAGQKLICGHQFQIGKFQLTLGQDI